MFTDFKFETNDTGVQLGRRGFVLLTTLDSYRKRFWYTVNYSSVLRVVDTTSFRQAAGLKWCDLWTVLTASL